MKSLTPKKLDSFKDQILLVLNDYASLEGNFLKSEGCRLDIANRLIANLKVIAK